AHTSARPAKRFGVYRNNVASGLAQALAIRFPATEAIVGREFFAAMAKAYIEREPPRSPVLLHYGASFAEFVAGFAPAKGLPYLADIVRLENARVRAYHAADMAPLAPLALAGAADRAAVLTFRFHPSFALVRSAYPIVTIWAMNAGELPLAPIVDWAGEDALVVRPRLNVLTRKLPPGGAVFLTSLAGGGTLMAAGEAALAEAEDFDLGANLAGMFESGLVIDAGEG
ncbi:MAG: putative DNA-binding domain-containing protein, partial [Rhizobiales bacterium]|nr:putative DNA-binding domain-containing protein [Hyphomicrobiales bacterium]